jgi:hypothetical protein
VIGVARADRATMNDTAGRGWAAAARRSRRLGLRGGRGGAAARQARGPVLVSGARPPREGELPSRIRAPANLQALELSSQRFDYDMGLLVQTRSGPQKRPEMERSLPGFREGSRPHSCWPASPWPPPRSGVRWRRSIQTAPRISRGKPSEWPSRFPRSGSSGVRTGPDKAPRRHPGGTGRSALLGPVPGPQGRRDRGNRGGTPADGTAGFLAF